MKKLDILMLKSFAGPFLLATVVCNFILLVQHLLRYFDDFVGKNLGFTVFAELLFYFSLNMLQVALPLGVLLASLITFGNLGENFELTAIKCAGISLLRTLRPIFIFIVVLSIGAYFFNNYTIPTANLKAYSLLYDIKHTKPALDIKEGTFYNGIPDYSIKAKSKLPDGKTLIDVIIYDHTQGRGNHRVMIADSSLMYTILDDRYLKLELYNGHYYSEEFVSNSSVNRLHRTKYHKMDMVFSLASFDLKRRKEELFQNNRQMKNISELTSDIDSFKNMVLRQKIGFIETTRRYFDYHMKNKKVIDKKTILKEEGDLEDEMGKVKASFLLVNSPIQKPQKDEKAVPDVGPQEDTLYANIFEWADTLDLVDEIGIEQIIYKEEVLRKNEIDKFELSNTLSRDASFQVSRKKSKGKIGTDKVDTLRWDHLYSHLKRKTITDKLVISDALNTARNIKENLISVKANIYEFQKGADLYTVEKYKKYAQALACILMFLIGAPLGAIIKKGGLGVPAIIAIFFFIIYYIFSSIGEKQAKEGAMNPYLAVWMSDMILLPFGLFFLRQARIDARIFELDAYLVAIERLKHKFAKSKKKT